MLRHGRQYWIEYNLLIINIGRLHEKLNGKYMPLTSSWKCFNLFGSIFTICGPSWKSLWPLNWALTGRKWRYLTVVKLYNTSLHLSDWKVWNYWNIYNGPDI